MTTVFPEPASTPDLRGLMLDYLDFLRGVVSGKVTGLTDDQLTSSVVPSGWSPAGLALHLAHVERRWLVWGFLGEQVEDPWADAAEDGGWLTPDLSSHDLRAMLDTAAARTRAIVESHELTDTARVGGRFADLASAPQLQWI